MKPRERAAYSAIVDRPPLRLPDGLRLILWPVVNLEVWEIERPMARQVLPAPIGAAVLPDIPNWSWHEYGMRVGVWRFFDAFDRYAIRPTLSINANVIHVYPRAAEAAREPGRSLITKNQPAFVSVGVWGALSPIASGTVRSKPKK